MDSFIEKDLYELIGVEQTASVEEIKKGYRRKALLCHPDKNRNNPKANELFVELSDALKVLTDASARAAYDKVINAKYQAKLRAKEFNSKRRKLIEDLEAREEDHRRSLNTDSNVKSDEEKFRIEKERLDREGSRLLQEEIKRMKKDLEDHPTDSTYTLKVKWKCNKSGIKNGGYNFETLHQIFSKYGVNTLVVSSTKGSALVEYKSKNDAEMALNMETGLAQNPLKLQKLWNAEEKSTVSNINTSCNNSDTGTQVNQNMSDIEYENYVLNNLRKAQEKKRSLEKLQKIENT